MGHAFVCMAASRLQEWHAYGAGWIPSKYSMPACLRDCSTLFSLSSQAARLEGSATSVEAQLVAWQIFKAAKWVACETSGPTGATDADEATKRGGQQYLAAALSICPACVAPSMQCCFPPWYWMPAKSLYSIRLAPGFRRAKCKSRACSLLASCQHTFQQRLPCRLCHRRLSQWPHRAWPQCRKLLQHSTSRTSHLIVPII